MVTKLTIHLIILFSHLFNVVKVMIVIWYTKVLIYPSHLCFWIETQVFKLDKEYFFCISQPKEFTQPLDSKTNRLTLCPDVYTFRNCCTSHLCPVENTISLIRMFSIVVLHRSKYISEVSHHADHFRLFPSYKL